MAEKVKKIRILTHTDLDGAAFPYVIERLCRIYEQINGCKYEVEISYGDVNNAEQIINQDFEKLAVLSDEKLADIFYLVMDIGNIGETRELITKVNELKSRGLNFSYIDHHYSLQMKELVKSLQNVQFIGGNKMCASMMAFMDLLNCYIGEDFNSLEEVYEHIDPQGITDKWLYLNNQGLIRTENVRGKLEFQKNFFRKMFDINHGNLNDERLKKVLSQSVALIYGTDFLDRGGVNNTIGPSIAKDYVMLARDYLNLVTEHTTTDLNSILDTITELLNCEAESRLFRQTKAIIKDLRDTTFLEQRVEESLNNTFFIRIYGENGPKNFVVFYAQGDIRYDIEAKRFNMGKVFDRLDLLPFKVDGAITFTRFTIGNTPIITVKPTVHKGNIFNEVNDLFIYEHEKKRGMDAGIGIEYDKKTYNDLSNSVYSIVKGRGDAEQERRYIKGTLMTKLREHFVFEELLPSHRERACNYGFEPIF